MQTGTPKGNASPFSRAPQRRTAPAQPRPASTTGAAGNPAMTDAKRQALESQRRSGGQWFYWVAGLSLINAGLALAGQEWRFILGLGVTQLVQELTQQSGSAGIKAGIVGLGVIGMFAVIGQRAIQGYRWAFVLGMVLFVLDGAIFLLVQDWVGVGFHAFALFMILRGYSAARQLPAPA